MKIISSIAQSSKQQKEILINSDIIRINNGHLNEEWFNSLYETYKDIFPPIFIDLQGHKVRVSNLFKREQKIINNEMLFFCSEEYYINNKLEFNKKYIPLNLKKDLSPISNCIKICLNNDVSFLNLEIINKDVLKVQVLGDGILRKEKGINFVGYDRRKLGITVKDLEFLNKFKKYNPEFICYSFVESKENIVNIKNFLNNDNVKYISKIESQYGIDNIDKILDVSDGILIGRGDMSKEIPIEKIPYIQNEIIKKCKEKNKEIYIGTDILKNMIKKDYPTVSEVTALDAFYKMDVTGIMLSDETIMGTNPIKCINICKKAMED